VRLHWEAARRFWVYELGHSRGAPSARGVTRPFSAAGRGRCARARAHGPKLRGSGGVDSARRFAGRIPRAFTATHWPPEGPAGRRGRCSRGTLLSCRIPARCRASAPSHALVWAHWNVAWTARCPRVIARPGGVRRGALGRLRRAHSGRWRPAAVAGLVACCCCPTAIAHGTAWARVQGARVLRMFCGCLSGGGPALRHALSPPLAWPGTAFLAVGCGSSDRCPGPGRGGLRLSTPVVAARAWSLRHTPARYAEAPRAGC